MRVNKTVLFFVLVVALFSFSGFLGAQTDAQTTSARFCPECGVENVDAATYCADCGAKLPVISEEENQSIKVPTEPVRSTRVNDDAVRNRFQEALRQFYWGEYQQSGLDFFGIQNMFPDSRLASYSAVLGDASRKLQQLQAEDKAFEFRAKPGSGSFLGGVILGFLLFPLTILLIVSLG